MSQLPHANAALTPRRPAAAGASDRDRGRGPRPVRAERYDVSWRTAATVGRPVPRRGGRPGWLTGPRGPHRPAEPHRRLRWSADRAPALEAAPGAGRDRRSAGDGVLDRARGPVGAGSTALTHSDRASGEPIRRYEHEHVGDLIHVDVKKLGQVPDGGGWRYVGREQGQRNRAATAARTGAPRSKYRCSHWSGRASCTPSIDDHSPRGLRRGPRRRDQRRPPRCAARRGGLVRPSRRERAAGAVRQRGAYRSFLWRDTCAELRHHRQAVPALPTQTNGKIERFHRTLDRAAGHSRSSTTPNQPGSPLCQHGSTSYNHHRPHSAIGKAAPITRLANLAGHHS